MISIQSLFVPHFGCSRLADYILFLSSVIAAFDSEFTYTFAEHMLFMGSADYPDENEVG